MASVRPVLVAVFAVVTLGAQPLIAQDLARYRGFVLGSSVASVVTATGARASDVKMSYERPTKIQELEWQTWLAHPDDRPADPVRVVVFRFSNDQLYQIVVTYDRDRIEGLTDADVIESVSATYGGPPLLQGRTTGDVVPAAVTTQAVVIARWEDGESLVTLTRGTYSPELQLILVSKTLNAGARIAINNALQLEAGTVTPPELALLRSKDVAGMRATSQNVRIANKAAFRP